MIEKCLQYVFVDFFIDIVWLLFIIYFWLEKIETDKKKKKKEIKKKEKRKTQKYKK